MSRQLVAWAGRAEALEGELGRPCSGQLNFPASAIVHWAHSPDPSCAVPSVHTATMALTAHPGLPAGGCLGGGQNAPPL